MTFASDLLADLDEIRAIPDELGLRPFDVVVRVVSWSGRHVGGGVSGYVDTPFLTGGGRRPKVKQVSERDIVASGGVYHEQDLKVGPLTPAYSASASAVGGGVSYDAIDPPVGPFKTEIYYRVSGGSMPSGGVWFDKVTETTDKAMNVYFVLRRSANRQPGGAP